MATFLLAHTNMYMPFHMSERNFRKEIRPAFSDDLLARVQDKNVSDVRARS